MKRQRPSLSRCAAIGLGLVITASSGCGGLSPAALSTGDPAPEVVSTAPPSPKPANTSTPTAEPDPNWPVLQTALDEAIEQAGEKLAGAEWGSTRTVLISLSFGGNLPDTAPRAVEYLRERLRVSIEQNTQASVADESLDNLPDTSADALAKLCRTSNLDAILVVELSAGYRPLEYYTPTTTEYRAEAYAEMFLSLFRAEEGYFPLMEWLSATNEGVYRREIPLAPTTEYVEGAGSSITAGQPRQIVQQLGLTLRPMVWFQDNHSFLYWSGEIKEIDGSSKAVGNLWLGNL